MKKKILFTFLGLGLLLMSFSLYSPQTKNQQKTQIIAAFQHSMILHNNQIWIWGKYKNFDANEEDILAPSITANLNDIVAVSEGPAARHILSIKSNGAVWALGDNKYGQVANFKSAFESFPVKVKGLDDVIQVTGGKGHSVALKSDGTVWTWGWNKNGQLGLDNTEDQTKVNKVPTLKNIIAISAGAKHTLALDKEGNVWAWGANKLGQLGLGTTEDAIHPKKITILKNIVSISAGSYHNIVQAADGKIFTWGWNNYGQVGNGTKLNWKIPVYIPLNDITSIKAGTLHCLALRKDGTVWAWGNNSFQQTADNHKQFIKIPSQIETLQNITSISAGDMHNVALDKYGKTWSWGLPNNGRLGNGDRQFREKPTIAFDINDLKGNNFYADLDIKAKGIAIKAASFEIFGLKLRSATSSYEIPNSNLIDTMYHMIKIGDDILLDKCPTEQALKSLDIHMVYNEDQSLSLSWTLANSDNYYINFFVEKSFDGINWIEIEEDLTILQNAEEKTDFLITDTKAAGHANIFYRLKELNCEDEYVYSNIIRTDQWLNETEGVFASKFTVSIDNPTEKLITYQIQDIKGNILTKKVLKDKKIAFTDGWDLKDGVYFMFLIDEELHHIMDFKKVTKLSEPSQLEKRGK